MADYEFYLPFPPSVNRWKTPFRGRMILTKVGRDYRTAVAEEMSLIGLTDEQIDHDCGSVSVRLELMPPTARRYDVDNFSKSLFDALTNCGFWVDDEVVSEMTVKKGKKRKGGAVKVSVTISR